MSDQALSRRLREIREAETIPDLAPEPGSTQDEEPDQPQLARRRPLGELLIAKGLLTEEALDAALEQQRRDGRPLGQILLAAGAVTPQNLARTLTEQHGFDFSGSLRERLTTGEQSPADSESDVPEPPETYLVVELGSPEPIHVASAFLDAADVAFELIDDEQPEGLEIIRFRDGEREQLWSYRREDEDTAQAS
jgi:hypothetical protein